VRMLQTREADIPIAAARMTRKRVVETRTGDDPPKRRKAAKTAKERQQ